MPVIEHFTGIIMDEKETQEALATVSPITYYILHIKY